MASLPTEPPPPLSSGAKRRRTAWFIAAFVAAQFVIPLTYLGREDGSDDRFTWRSLASEAAPRCQTRAELVPAEGARIGVALQSVVHPGWVPFVQRGRQAVVDALLRAQCAAHGVERVELVTTCEGNSRPERVGLRCGPAERKPETRTAAR